MTEKHLRLAEFSTEVIQARSGTTWAALIGQVGVTVKIKDLSDTTRHLRHLPGTAIQLHGRPDTGMRGRDLPVIIHVIEPDSVIVRRLIPQVEHVNGKVATAPPPPPNLAKILHGDGTRTRVDLPPCGCYISPQSPHRPWCRLTITGG